MSERSARDTIYDSVFTSLFSDPRYQLQLFQDLHPEMEGLSVDDIEDVTLEAVFLNQMYNDLGFTVRHQAVFLLEAQSTWCPNMALRTLLYLAETLKGYTVRTQQNFYSERAVTLPRPELYVLYTGDKPHAETEISLADVHWGGDDSFVDVRVKVIYGDAGDSILSQYAAFTAVYKEKVRQYGRTETAVSLAIDECIRRGILAEYLSRKRAEVVSIMMSLFDKEQNQKMYGNSERAEGRKEGRADTVAAAAWLIRNGRAAEVELLTDEQFLNACLAQMAASAVQA